MINALSVTLSSYTKTTTNTVWPFETFPNYEEVVSNYRRMSHSRLIATIPMVEDTQKEEWEVYAEAEQGWIKQSYQAMGLDIEPLPIHPTIYNLVDGVATEALQGPFLPLWQTSPPPKNTGVVNYNMESNAEFSKAIDVALQNHEAILTQVTDINVILDDGPDEYSSLLVQPIHQDASDHESKVVGAIVASLSWDVFFTDLVREGNQGMVSVLTNTCGDSLTWKLQGGLASFLGEGDLHDPEYNEYEYVTKLTPFSQLNAETTPGYCEYTINIYPTSQIEDNFISNAPAIYTSIMVIIFLLFGVSFLYYDHTVQKRQREASASAAKSDALVDSLFPAEIRDRLFKGDEMNGDNNNKKGGKADNNNKDLNKDDLLSSLPEAQKFRLKNFLDEEDAEDNKAKAAGSNGQSTIRESKPIADLFPNTTVMFADISGFTAWSSVREPSQVFTLLETVYKSFDKTAKRRKVFKVETVG